MLETRLCSCVGVFRSRFDFCQGVYVGLISTRWPHFMFYA